MERGQIDNTQPNFADLQGTWLISFADLITLLLCAFLMFFSLTWNKSTPAGTQIAPKDKKSQEVNPLERRIKLRFLKEDVELTTGKLTEEGLMKIKSVVNSEAYKDAAVTVSSCDSAATGETEQALLSQLVDTGVPVKRLVTRFVGGNCRLLRAPNESEPPEAIIEFERM